MRPRPPRGPTGILRPAMYDSLRAPHLDVLEDDHLDAVAAVFATARRLTPLGAVQVHLSATTLMMNSTDSCCGRVKVRMDSSMVPWMRTSRAPRGMWSQWRTRMSAPPL